MKTGSKEHKRQVCEDLIMTYHENIWKDEIYLLTLQQAKKMKLTEIASIDLKLERKEYKSKNEGDKAKFVAGRELAAIEQEIAAVTEKVLRLWPERIKMVQAYLEQK